MSERDNLPMVAPEAVVSVLTPVIPLNFVYPGLSLAQILSIVNGYRWMSLVIVIRSFSCSSSSNCKVDGKKRLCRKSKPSASSAPLRA